MNKYVDLKVSRCQVGVHFSDKDSAVTTADRFLTLVKLTFYGERQTALEYRDYFT